MIPTTCIQLASNRSRHCPEIHPRKSPDLPRALNNIVFEIHFPDDVVWICRVYKRGAKSNDCVRANIESTVATMRYVKKEIPSSPIPAVYDYASDPETNSIGAGYILMETMDGFEVGMSGPFNVEDVYTQLATAVRQSI